jgi:Carboxymuconolactone decarboxylase family
MHARAARKAGETGERLSTLAAWRDASYFNDAERAALALAEAATRLADRADPVPDEVFEEARKHYDERRWRPWSSRSPRSTPGTGSTSPQARWQGSGLRNGWPEQHAPAGRGRPSAVGVTGRLPGQRSRPVLPISSSGRALLQIAAAKSRLRRLPGAHQLPRLRARNRPGRRRLGRHQRRRVPPDPGRASGGRNAPPSPVMRRWQGPPATPASKCRSADRRGGLSSRHAFERS